MPIHRRRTPAEPFGQTEATETPKIVAGGQRDAQTVTDEGRVAHAPENEGRGFDFVKFAEACGAMGERVTDPGEIKTALKRGVESGIPYIVEIILEEDTDCSMGTSIDSIKEFE